MDQVFIDGKSMESEKVDLENTSLDELFFKRALKEKKGMMILTKHYMVGSSKFFLGNLTIDYRTKLVVTEEKITARVFYPFEEFKHLLDEPDTKEINRNGRKLIEATAVVEKSDIIMMLIHEMPK